MNEQTKPTPGPWEAFIVGDVVEVRASGRKQKPAVSWAGFDESDVPIEVHRANARLIADAPNMLQWLRQIALTNCTCDSWENAAEINPTVHDLYCLYRAMTGYQDTAEKVETQ